MIDKGNLSTWRKNLPHVQFVHQKSYMDCPGIEPGPVWWEARLTAWAKGQPSNWLSLGLLDSFSISIGMMIVNGTGCSLFEGAVSTFAERDWGKPWSALIRLSGVLGKILT